MKLNQCSLIMMVLSLFCGGGLWAQHPHRGGTNGKTYTTEIAKMDGEERSERPEVLNPNRTIPEEEKVTEKNQKELQEPAKKPVAVVREAEQGNQYVEREQPPRKYSLKSIPNITALFEPFATMHVFHHYLVMFTVYKPKSFENELKMVNHIIEAIRELLLDVSFSNCQDKLGNIKGQRGNECATLRIIKKKLSLMVSLAALIDRNNGVIHYSRRSKRSFFDGAGSLLRWVIGVTDSKTEKEIMNNIEDIQKKADNLNAEMGTQIKIVGSLYSAINETTTQAADERKQLSERLQQVQSSLIQTSNATHILQLQTEVEQLVSLAALELQEIEQQQRNTMDILMALQGSILPPALLDPQEIAKIYQNISAGLQMGSNMGLSTLQQIMELETLPRGGKILIKLRMPIIQTSSYKLYQIYPIPTRLTPKTVSFLKLESNYLATDKLNNRYIGMTNTEVDNCIRISTYTDEVQVLCSPRTPVEIGAVGSCATILFKNAKVEPNPCETHVSSVKSFVTVLRAHNSWLIYPATPVRMEVICGKEDPEKLWIRELSTLQIIAGCHFIFQDLLFTATGVENKNISLTQIEMETATDMIWSEDLNNHFERYRANNDDQIRISNPLLKANQWQDGSKSLKQLTKEYEREQERIKETMTYRKQVIVMNIGSIGTIFLLIIVIISIWRFRKRCVRRVRHPEHLHTIKMVEADGDIEGQVQDAEILLQEGTIKKSIRQNIMPEKSHNEVPTRLTEDYQATSFIVY